MTEQDLEDYLEMLVSWMQNQYETPVTTVWRRFAEAYPHDAQDLREWLALRRRRAEGGGRETLRVIS